VLDARGALTDVDVAARAGAIWVVLRVAAAIGVAVLAAAATLCLCRKTSVFEAVGPEAVRVAGMAARPALGVRTVAAAFASWAMNAIASPAKDNLYRSTFVPCLHLFLDYYIKNQVLKKDQNPKRIAKRIQPRQAEIQPFEFFYFAHTFPLSSLRDFF